MKRTFTIGQILSHYTGVLMCDIGGVYEIANFLASDNLFTHQLPRAGREAQPWLLESLPWLAGLTHELSPIPHGEELHRNPFEEAEEMAPGRVIKVEL